MPVLPSRPAGFSPRSEECVCLVFCAVATERLSRVVCGSESIASGLSVFILLRAVCVLVWGRARLSVRGGLISAE